MAKRCRKSRNFRDYIQVMRLYFGEDLEITTELAKTIYRMAVSDVREF